MTSKELLNLIVRLMKDASVMKDLVGDQKKRYVINRVKQELELPEIVEELIGEFINLIIKVDKGKLKINEKEIKKAFLSIVCC